MEQIIDEFCGKDGLVRKLDGIYAAPAEGEKQGVWALSVHDYWQRVCLDLKDGRLIWAARLEPHSPKWDPMSGRLATQYEPINVDHGILKGPGRSVVYDACFLWTGEGGPSAAPTNFVEDKRGAPGRLRVDWSSPVQEVLVRLISFGLPPGKGKLIEEIIEENVRQLESLGQIDREGSRTSAVDFVTGKWLKAAKSDPGPYLQAYADLLTAIYDAAGRKSRQPGTTMKRPPL
ncbi:hypothetical protein WI560_13570 [Bradyrhizobium sp. A11]|uniref:hypothetical protein n=1 Tax=Bradyrhizobium sp. A11 TaxID=3133974 RepID=UPI00324F8013